MAQADLETGPPRRLRVRSGELISATCGLLLVPIMFAVQWYGVVGEPGIRRSGTTGTENAWQGLTTIRWVMLVTAAVAIGAVLLHATQRSHGNKTNTSVPVSLLGTVTAVLLVYRVLIDPPSSSSVVDTKIGAVLGLLCAIGIAIGGYESIHEERARRISVGQRSRSKTRLESRPEPR